ncbi:hypothetical protein MXMO3_01678 [Maritalea myrionectae]|uniref:Uncharacterized protein n=1 Tax=Maritalea myrionectae TaxID=454601 RepID=A0A2R4ME55_9HYPH|nr:hypothetical protein [Maritalea myrionectae]AVX04204.1 hypothetical protein MXMO3_01678 [Maritalea myrionectae]
MDNPVLKQMTIENLRSEATAMYEAARKLKLITDNLDEHLPGADWKAGRNLEHARQNALRAAEAIENTLDKVK